MWPVAYASRERASIATISENPALRSTDKSHESVWKRSLSSIILAVSPGSGAPYSRTAEISRAMNDSVIEALSDFRSSEPDAQPVSGSSARRRHGSSDGLAGGARGIRTLGPLATVSLDYRRGEGSGGR